MNSFHSILRISGKGNRMNDTPSASDRLLDAWLALSSTLWNTRIVSSMTYNECHILGILHRGGAGARQTATDLIARTHLLKSQMNKVLTTLEGKGFITRERAAKDKRQVLIHLTSEGIAAYIKEHARIEALMSRLITRIGEDKALALAGDLQEISCQMDDLWE